jgi:hypothetical protein
VSVTPNTRRILLALLGVVGVCGSGCRPKPPPPAEDLPAYQWVDKETAIRDLRARADAVRTVSAECTITLTRADGDTVQLDGAIVTRNPGWVRLRAWKLNRAVFDLTLQPAGLWVMTPRGGAKREGQMLPANVSAATFVRQWSYFNGELFRLASAGSAKVNGNTLTLFDGTDIKAYDKLHCEIDLRTLTPRRYVYNDYGERQFELVLDQYRDVNGIPWPHRLVAAGEMGTVVIEQRNVEINGEVAPDAFVPPRRAEKQS